MKTRWNDLIETVYLISAKARKDKAFQEELATVIKKYMPELLSADTDTNKTASEKTASRKNAHKKKAITDQSSDAPLLNPLEFSVSEEEKLREKLLELELKDLRILIRTYNLDPFKQTSSWKKKERIVDVMMETIHQRLTDGAALQRN